MSFKEYLDQKGIRQNFIAKKLNVSPQAVNYWVAGKIPSNRNIKRLSELFNENLKDIFFDFKCNINVAVDNTEDKAS